MSRHVEVNNASTIMGQNNKHEQNLKPDAVDREKVDRRLYDNQSGTPA
jgi:hypothetical protein